MGQAPRSSALEQILKDRRDAQNFVRVMPLSEGWPRSGRVGSSIVKIKNVCKQLKYTGKSVFSQFRLEMIVQPIRPNGHLSIPGKVEPYIMLMDFLISVMDL